jgi:hypothetical protein
MAKQKIAAGRARSPVARPYGASPQKRLGSRAESVLGLFASLLLLLQIEQDLLDDEVAETVANKNDRAALEAGLAQQNVEDVDGPSGRVAPSGAVSFTVVLGLYQGVASERLSNNSGGGSWRIQGPNLNCSGTWSAQRI